MAVKCIALPNARSNMILAKPVIDEQGRTLCGQGTKLSDRLINRFEKMGVDSIYIEVSTKISIEALNQELNLVEERFKNITSSSILGRFKTIILQHFEKLKKE